MNIAVTCSDGRVIEIPDIAQVVCRMSNRRTFLAIVQPMMNQETVIQLAKDSGGFRAVQMANDCREFPSHSVKQILSLPAEK